MAKPKSENKRNAILSAAIQVFAERGLGAPTAAITSAAGIAEGSLFTYIKTKDELIKRVVSRNQAGVGGCDDVQFPA
jgi:AcrR family transcriptional regulator